jgi:hypothetical protein
MQIMSQKFQYLPLIYLKEKNEWIVNHIHLHLFLIYQINHQVPFTTLESKIWSLRFGQVYIVDLPLLLT